MNIYTTTAQLLQSLNLCTYLRTEWGMSIYRLHVPNHKAISLLFLANELLRDIASNLDNYIKYESWKYCDKCHIVEPNKMLPNYGHQKMTPITNCICSKGRYFVPMVCLTICFLLSYAIALTIPALYLTSFFASSFSL